MLRPSCQPQLLLLLLLPQPLLLSYLLLLLQLSSSIGVYRACIPGLRPC
jgi:hypothetical protein